MSDILVTGGYGLIGHNVVRRLRELKHRVIIVDTQTNYGIIPQDEIDYLMSERKKKTGMVENVGFDISDRFLMHTAFVRFQPDIVIHMASFPRQKVVNANPPYGAKVMSEGLLNLLEESKLAKVKKFIYISSSMVYGDFTDDVTEDAICNPQGQYGIMKLAGEWLVKDYSRRNCFNHTIIRPSAVYGPLDVEDRVIAKFMLQQCVEECLMLTEPERPSTSPMLMTRLKVSLPQP
jgi:UDP-glucose 4-epimerase